MAKTGTALSSGGRVYVYDEAGRLLGEYDTAGARIAEHVWLGGMPVALIGPGGGYYPVLADHLGTPRQVIDTQLRLRWRWDNREPFGYAAPNQNPDGLGAFTYNLRFPGHYFDAESGLHYNDFRDYDPRLGRYVESDPVGLAGGMNTYAYVNNNPLYWTDQLGLKEWICKRRVNGLPGENGVFKHTYACITKPDGTKACSSSTPVVEPKSLLDSLKPRKARATSSKDGDFLPDDKKERDKSCELVNDDSNMCYEDCMLKEMAKPRPEWAIGWSGTSCEDWTDNADEECSKKCYAEEHADEAYSQKNHNINLDFSNRIYNKDIF